MAGGSSVHETSAQVALAQQAQRLMTDYKARWLPVQQQLATQIENLGSKSSPLRGEAVGKATTDSAIQFDQAQSKAESGLSSRGVAPGSGRFDLGLTGMQNDQARSSGLGSVLSDQAIDDAYTKGLTGLMQIGQGQSAEVSAGMTDQARASGLQAQADAQASLSNSESQAGVLGQVAGVGLQQWLKPPAPTPAIQGNNPSAYVGG